MRSERVETIRRRLLGVGFIFVLVALVGLSVLKYQGAFSSGVEVTLQADHVGNQLQERSDVKLRGLIVGEVTDVRTSGDSADVSLSLRPDMVDLIPRNVSARLLPKTLFGERFVALVVPDQADADPLAAGDVITQDRTETARELERALDGLLPLLQAVEPAQLASTLGAMSQALEGRGAELGDTLVLLQRYISELNTALPDIQHDISALADFANTYAEAAPELVETLADLTTTSRTIVEQRQNLSTMFSTVTNASGDLRSFLEVNRENLIGLSEQSRPTLESLARYSPEFPCFFEALSGLVPRIDEVFGVGTDQPGIHVTLEVVNSLGEYEPNRDEPEYLDDRGPRCYQNAFSLGDRAPQHPPDGGPLRDGSQPPPMNRNATEPHGSSELTPPQRVSADSADLGLPNSHAERQMIAEVLAAATGQRPSQIPNWSGLLVGPLLRGTEVTLR